MVTSNYLLYNTHRFNPVGNFSYLAPCVRALDLNYLGYDARVDGKEFTIMADGTAIFSALSFAYGIAPLSYFTYIDNVVQAGEFYGVLYRVDRYYDAANNVMHPMHCIKPVDLADDDNSQTSCYVAIGAAFGLPFFHHSGADPTQQQAIPCKCNIPAQNNDQW